MPLPLRVVIAEDSQDDADLLILELSKIGREPVLKRVETGAELRSALAEGGWHLVLCDYSMPGFGAVDALSICRASDPDLPFIVVSGTIGELQAVEMMRAGATDYLLKTDLARLHYIIERELRVTESRHERRRAAQELARLAAIVESSGDAIFSETLDGIITTWNYGAETLFGWTEAEVLGKHVSFFVPKENAAELASTMDHLRQGNRFKSYETVRLHQDGSSRNVIVTVSQIRSQNGQLVGFSKIARDITAQKAAEKTQSLLAAIVDSSEDAIMSVDREERVQTWNPSAERLFGYTAVQSLDGAEYLIPPHLIDDIRDKTERLWRGDHIPPFETVRLRKGGEPVEVSIAMSAVRVGGTIVAKSVIIRDLSHRNRAERENRMLRSIIDYSPEFIAVSHQNARMVFVNRAGQALLGLHGDEEVSRTSVADLHSREEMDRIGREIIPILQRGGSVRGEIAFRHVRTGATIPAEAIIFGIPNLEDGQPTFFSCIAHDITERKRVERNLLESEERYRTVVTATSSIVATCPPTGEFNSPQPSWTAFTGQTLEQHQGWGWLDMIHPDDRDHSARAWALAVAERSDYQVEYRLRRADGVYRHMSVRGVPVLDPSGEIREWVGVHTDVTDLKRVERERAELLSQLNLQIERMPLGYLLSGPDFCYTRWNAAAERMFGFGEAEIRGKHPLGVIVPAQSQALVADIFTRLAQGDMNADGTCENITKNGTTIICEWHNTPLFDPDGEFQGILSLVQDVTARWRSEEALVLRDRAIAAATQGIAISDSSLPDNPIIYVNPAFERITGYASEEFLGRNCRFLQGQKTDRQAVAELRQAIATGTPCTVEMLNYRKDGTTFWNELSISPVRDTTGRLTHFVGVQTDITDRRTLEEQFRQAQKMEAFGQLAGGVAHDFNNLLTIINGYSDLLLHKLPPGEGRKMITEINRAGEQSAGLTRQLLAFSRQQVLAPKILNLNEVVAETDKLLRRLIGEDIRLTTTLDSEPWAIRADAGQIEQVLLNLAVNARDAMPRGGRLTIETRNILLDATYTLAHRDVRPGPYVLLSVTDTGTGMTREIMAKIFEPFFTTKERGKGTGLGLATVYGIVKQSGGHVAVYSEVGVGTTFKVYLPQVEGGLEDSKPPSSRGQNLPRGTETVLLAEDEAPVRELSRYILTRCGYTVLQAADGVEAFKTAVGYSGPIHLLITDVVMPRAGGRVLAEQLTERYPNLRVLFVSGYTDDAVIRHGVLRDGVHFLQKPYAPAVLALKVREVLDASAK